MVTTVIIHLWTPVSVSSCCPPLAPNKALLAFWSPAVHILMAGSEKFSLLVITGKREQHAHRVGGYLKVKTHCDADAKGPTSPLSWFCSCFPCVLSKPCLEGAQPSLSLLTTPHVLPKQQAGGAWLTPKPPGGDLVRLDL